MAELPGASTALSSAYVSMFEHSIDGFLLTASDGQIFRANPRACELLGLSEEEIVGRGREGIVDRRDPRWAEAIEIRGRTGAYRGVLHVRRGDGTGFPAEFTSALLPHGAGAYVSFRDMTAAEAEASRVAETRRAAAEVIDTLESFSDMYIGVDSDWRVTYVNAQAEVHCGVSRDAVVGRDVWEQFPDLIGTPVEDAYREAVRTGLPVVVEVFSPELASWTETRVFPLRRGGLGVYFRDITERRGLEQERERRLASEQAARAAAEQAQLDLARQVHHDDLTGLLNRAGLRQQIESYRALWPTTGLTVLLIDLDQLKLVNDSLGHRVGDRVLTAFGQRLCHLAGPTDLVGRFSGDAFVIVRFDASTAAATEMAEAVIAAARQPVDGWSRLTVTVSIGLARTTDGADLDDLMQQADAAVYRAKDAGRDQAAWFDQQMHLESVRRLQTEHDLRQALERDELFLDYQPAFDLRCEGINHVEALIRWQHPTRGLVPPLDFIPVAEDSGLIQQVGEWVLARAVEQAARWAHIPGLRVWINVSPQQLAHRGLPDLIAAHLDRVGLPASRLGIEVTESTMADQANLTRVLQEIRALGVAIAIDDFGTGYSSLARLSTFPVDVIKIDKSFVADVQTTRGEAVLAGIVTLAHATGAHVIAEGVETEAQLRALSTLGVDSASGYLLARPSQPGHLPLPRPTDPSFHARAGLHPSLQNLLGKLATVE